MCIRDRLWGWRRTRPSSSRLRALSSVWRCRRVSLLHGSSQPLSLIHISEPTRLLSISYAVFCLKKKKKYFFFFFFFFNDTATTEIYTRSLVGSVRCV